MDSWLFLADVALFAAGAHRVTRVALPDEPATVRAVHSIALATCAGLTVLVLVAAYRQLHPAVVTVAAAAFAGVAWWWASSRPTAAPPRTAPPKGEPLARLPLLVPLLAFLPHLLRSMASPPRAWDALTYHLPRAASWVQDGGFVPHVAPDANRYYEYFSPGGDLVFAFTMLAGHGDALLFLVYVGAWAANVVAVLALAETLGARPLDASLAAAVVMTLPCVVQLSASAYVDGFVLFLTLASVTLAVRAAQATRGSATLMVTSLLCAGACAVTKSSAVPLVALVAGFGVYLVARGRVRGRFVGSALAVALVPLSAWMVHTAAHTGSPTYPLALRLGDLELTGGNPLFRITHDASAAFMATPDPSVSTFMSGLFIGSAVPEWPHLNLGLGGAVAIAVGLVSLGLARRLSAPVRGLLLVAALLPLALVLLPSATALRTLWGPVTGRLISGLVGVLACVAAGASTRYSRAGLVVALVAGIPTLLPAGLAWEDLELGALPIGIGTLGLLAALGIARVDVRPPVRLAVVAVALLLAPFGFEALASTRDAVRATYYAAPTFEFHPAPIASQAPLWAALDGAEPEHVALSVGWVPPGHNWFRYPLYGSRLQNRVSYVSATRSGAVRDTWDRRVAPAELDADRYEARLRREGITAIVIVAPEPPEAALVMDDPSRFELGFEAPTNDSLVYGLRPAPP